MRRKKSVKRANKKQTANNILATVQKVEKDWLKTPVKLAAQLEKEIKAHNKREKKLGKLVSKLDHALQKSEARIAKAENNAPSAANKKQLKAVLKKFDAKSKLYDASCQQLDAIAASLNPIAEKHAEIVALINYVNQFQKEWKKASNNAKAKPQQAKNKKAGKQKKAGDASRNQPADSEFNNEHFDDAAEIA